MKNKGKLLLLYASIDDVMTLIAACTNTTVTISSETVDTTSKGDTWRELLNAGISSFDVKTQGLANSSASYQFLKNCANNSLLFNAQIQADNGELVYDGAFLITSFESSGEYNKAELFAVTLQSSSQAAASIYSFRLLENGDFRLLEDGEKRVLE